MPLGLDPFIGHQGPFEAVEGSEVGHGGHHTVAGEEFSSFIQEELEVVRRRRQVACVEEVPSFAMGHHIAEALGSRPEEGRPALHGLECSVAKGFKSGGRGDHIYRRVDLGELVLPEELRHKVDLVLLAVEVHKVLRRGAIANQRQPNPAVFELSRQFYEEVNVLLRGDAAGVADDEALRVAKCESLAPVPLEPPFRAEDIRIRVATPSHIHAFDSPLEENSRVGGRHGVRSVADPAAEGFQRLDDLDHPPRLLAFVQQGHAVGVDRDHEGNVQDGRADVEEGHSGAHGDVHHICLGLAASPPHLGQVRHGEVREPLRRVPVEAPRGQHLGAVGALAHTRLQLRLNRQQIHLVPSLLEHFNVCPEPGGHPVHPGWQGVAVQEHIHALPVASSIALWLHDGPCAVVARRVSLHVT
mmetsp:Transcript_18095/g.52861  ORF Transcript_18095/g.52861 Transcript_18095/m.52861 type:complete len:414 (-) Transcript_18095:118-1359(-)